MKLNWKKIPIELPCPNCQGKEDPYEEIQDAEWRYILPKTHESLKDYHKCPQCKKVWILLRDHIDQL
ncbi:MAG: hypothetical protein ACTSRC_20755 [Candidatus Helarchaeota archaeon]